MRYAIFGDAHGNLEALETFLAYTRKAKVDRYFMLGDLVGYGANPQEVSDKVFEISDVVILGNHDKAVSDDELLKWFNENARKAIVWTRSYLSQATVRRLETLEYLHVHEKMTLTHGSPFQPELFHYIYDWPQAENAFRALTTPICFIGHTHLPQMFSEKACDGVYMEEGVYDLSRDDRYIISCGSIGQPRDADHRLSFGIFDDQKYSLELIRLPYPKEEAARKIREAGLPKYFADRLM